MEMIFRLSSGIPGGNGWNPHWFKIHIHAFRASQYGRHILVHCHNLAVFLYYKKNM